jgi:hypothetical protein
MSISFANHNHSSLPATSPSLYGGSIRQMMIARYLKGNRKLWAFSYKGRVYLSSRLECDLDLPPQKHDLSGVRAKLIQANNER